MHRTERTFVLAGILGAVLFVFAGAGLFLYTKPKTLAAVVLFFLWFIGGVTVLSSLLCIGARRTLTKQHWRMLTGEEKDE